MQRLLAILVVFLLTGVAAAEPAITTFRLDNGMDVVVIEDHRAPVVTHMVWYRVGGADDPRGKSGVAHFLEHLMFKGTNDIPESAFSKIIAANGGQDNAFTTQDYTGYFQRIAVDRLELVMRMEADRMRNLVLTEALVNPERDVVIEERNSRVENDPGSIFSEQRDAAFFLNHPYGIPVIGWKQEIEGLSLEDSLAFYRRYYAPNNAILVVAGDSQRRITGQSNPPTCRRGSVRRRRRTSRRSASATPIRECASLTWSEPISRRRAALATPDGPRRWRCWPRFWAAIR
jgi:zinc protease